MKLRGIVTSDGAAVKVGAALLPLPHTSQPVREWAAGLLPCRHCGAVGGCACEDWIEEMKGEVTRERN